MIASKMYSDVNSLLNYLNRSFDNNDSHRRFPTGLKSMIIECTKINIGNIPVDAFNRYRSTASFIHFITHKMELCEIVSSYTNAFSRCQTIYIFCDWRHRYQCRLVSFYDIILRYKSSLMNVALPGA